MRAFGVLFARGRAELDDGFEREAHVLESLGVPIAPVDLDALAQDDVRGALAALPRRRGWTWLYRGWMLFEEDYTALWEAILDRGDRLVVPPSSHAEASYLPLWAPQLGDRTPTSVWTESEDPTEAWEAAQDLGPPPWIIKDHLKSARHWWDRACYVPAGADQAAFERVCEGLLEFHQDRFQRGFVVRRFVELRPLPWRAEGHPVFDEHRVFFWKGRPVAHAPYHDVDDVRPLTRIPFPELGRLIDSPFFAADIGRLAAGGHTVVEINDGGAASLPAQLDPWALYEAILADPI